MFGYDWPRLHAALNDLPAALLLAAVVFDLSAALTRRESLRSAALWTLWAGVVGGWIAVVAGLRAEDALEHGEAIHELMETHETIALVTMGLFTLILAYKLFRRARLSRTEELVSRVLGIVGVTGVVWTGVLGGKLMFEHAAGIPSATIRAEMMNREAGHRHAPGAESADHAHDPGTPPHKH